MDRNGYFIRLAIAYLVAVAVFPGSLMFEPLLHGPAAGLVVVALPVTKWALVVYLTYIAFLRVEELRIGPLWVVFLLPFLLGYDQLLVPGNLLHLSMILPDMGPLWPVWLLLQPLVPIALLVFFGLLDPLPVPAPTPVKAAIGVAFIAMLWMLPDALNETVRAVPAFEHFANAVRTVNGLVFPAEIPLAVRLALPVFMLYVALGYIVNASRGTHTAVVRRV